MAWNILVIDDHPMIIDGYERALKQISKESGKYKFTIHSAKNSDAAIELIELSKTGKLFDIVFLDIKIEPSSDGKILSGEDIGELLRKNFKDIRIIVGTTYNDGYRLSSILKNVSPDALMIKTDMTHRQLKNAILDILEGGTFYSNTVSKLFRFYSENDYYPDDKDRRLLYELSMGAKMVELPIKLEMSMGGVERRKRKLREVFDVTKQGDRALIEKAREKGFI